MTDQTIEVSVKQWQAMVVKANRAKPEWTRCDKFQFASFVAFIAVTFCVLALVSVNAMNMAFGDRKDFYHEILISREAEILIMKDQIAELKKKCNCSDSRLSYKYGVIQ